MSEEQQEVFVVKCGAQTAVGDSAELTAANVYGEMCRLSAHKCFEGSNFEPIKTGYARYINIYIEILRRFLLLSKPALEEALTPIREIEPEQEILPVYIGLPENRPGLPEELEEELKKELNTLSHSFNLEFDIRFFTQGHAAPVYAYEKLKEQLLEDQPFLAVVGGIDSYMDFFTMRWLEENRLLKHNGFKGIVPGEAAGFVLLANTAAVKKYQLNTNLRWVSAGTGQEEKSIFSGTNSLGEGLAEAILKAVETLPENEKVDEISGPLTGCAYHYEEFGMATGKVAPFFKHLDMIRSYSENWGDIGAASLPVFINFVFDPDFQAEARGPYHLLFGSSFGTDRGAILLQITDKV